MTICKSLQFLQAKAKSGTKANPILNAILYAKPIHGLCDAPKFSIAAKKELLVILLESS
jgi:hypothetical protein